MSAAGSRSATTHAQPAGVDLTCEAANCVRTRLDRYPFCREDDRHVPAFHRRELRSLYWAREKSGTYKRLLREAKSIIAAARARAARPGGRDDAA